MSEHSTPTGVRRRDFLKILGVTGAAGASVGCNTDTVEKLIPYLVHPDETVPGVSSYYATTCRECATGCGVIAEVRDGRAIKLEGNPAHPVNRGALCARGQAALQGLYNPDRYRAPMARRSGRLEPITWDEGVQLLSRQLAQLGGGASSAVFLNRHESGSFPSFLDGWLSAFGMPPHLSVDALADSAVMEANRQSYGVPWPSLDFGAARLVVSIGADFLDGWGASVPQQLDFADARARLRDAPRLVYIGARRSLTGLNADEWIPCRPGSELAIATALLGAVRGGAGSLDQAAQAADVPVAALQRLAVAIRSARPSLVVSGVNGANATDVALAVNAINQAAGNVGTTIRTSAPLTGFDGTATAAELVAAVERMRSGQVPILFVRNVNPVFTLPRGLNVSEALGKVPFKVSFSSYPDETSELCDLILPDHHPLESWGDAQPVPGVVALQQPTMDPVFRTRPTADLLLDVMRANPPANARLADGGYRDVLMRQFPGGAAAMATALQTGLSTGSVPARTAPARQAATAPAAPPLDQQQGDFYFHVFPHSVLGDGSGANKPWLQELPDPVSKVCWQSWIEMHPATARRLGVESGDVLRVETPAGAVEAPAYVYPGIRQDTVAMAFGQGHTAYGRYADDVGVNPMDALPAAFDRSGAFAWTSSRARVTRTGRHEPLVTTEGSARQHGRGIARAIVAGELGAHPASGAEHATSVAPQGDPASAQEPAGAESHAETKQGAEGGHGGGHAFPGDASHEFLPGLRSPVAQDAQGELGSDDNRKGMYREDHWSNMAKRRWAMTIDLARCTGCSACVTACYAENNIPTVGAPYQQQHTQNIDRRPGANILRSREMAWIRLERYYEGGEDGSADFETRFVPMLCQHCGNAPCEPVCPVYATYHSPDGLNVQVYNRCVGTRYCSNNCPYKVRYFNWFGYGEPRRPQYAWPEPLNWQLNPEVTVRGKGVMEKCTFCVQRIREAEHRAKLENRPVRPDEFTVACAQACPSRAIVFGDAADAAWSVSRTVHDERAYHVFEELNTFTAVVYLKKVNHPASATPAGA
ncbi:MAG TPA: 4Fe-4S dicluster domain-containing protein [Gemmatimonadaceae bacterium]|nr:4Fe-4S dicluster domain-containing protein [Gemmatimonadaceae bacterium]